MIYKFCKVLISIISFSNIMIQVYQFMETRINTAIQNKTTLRDSVSLILFNSNVMVPFENRNLKDPNDTKDLLNIMLQNRASGGTNFDLAIQKAGYLITTYFDPTKLVDIFI